MLQQKPRHRSGEALTLQERLRHSQHHLIYTTDTGKSNRPNTENHTTISRRPNHSALYSPHRTYTPQNLDPTSTRPERHSQTFYTTEYSTHVHCYHATTHSSNNKTPAPATAITLRSYNRLSAMYGAAKRPVNDTERSILVIFTFASRRSTLSAPFRSPVRNNVCPICT
jgi:hypothetical protein